MFGVCVCVSNVIACCGRKLPVDSLTKDFFRNVNIRLPLGVILLLLLLFFVLALLLLL